MQLQSMSSIHWNRSKFDYYHRVPFTTQYTNTSCSLWEEVQRVVTCVEQRLLLENEGNWDRDPELNFHFPVFVVCLDKNYNNSRLYVALDWSAALVPSGRGTASTSTPIATNTRCRREMMDVQTQNLKNENWSKHVEGINFPPLFVPRFNRQCLWTYDLLALQPPLVDWN